MIIELALIIIIVIILITELLKYIQPSLMLNRRPCGNHNQETFNQDMESVALCRTRRNNLPCRYVPDADPQKLLQRKRKIEQKRQSQIKKANNPTEISEDTLFSRDMGSGVSLKYW